jgi:hypothetical protein
VGVVEEEAKMFFYGINPKTNLHRGANNRIMPLDRCNDHKICRKLPINETAGTPMTSTCLSADCPELKGLYQDFLVTVNLF